MRKHENQKIPDVMRKKRSAATKPKKFTQKDFEFLFNRGFTWIQHAQEAGETIRSRRQELQDSGDLVTLENLNAFLAGEVEKDEKEKRLGVKTLIEVVKHFGEPDEDDVE